MLMNYYRTMDRGAVQFDFLVHRAAPAHYDEEILSMGGRIYRMPPIRPGRYRRYFRLLDRFFEEHAGQYRIVHAHLNENSAFVLRAARRAGVPCRIAHSHLSGLGLDWKLPFRLYARHALKDQPTHRFACSAAAGQWLFGKPETENGGVTMIRNAVPVRDFARNEDSRRAVRQELELEGKLAIGHVGRFDRQKNHRYLLRVFKAVRERNPDSVLVLAGDGPLRRKAERWAAAAGLSGHVRFVGVCRDVPRLLQGLDLFVLPSLFEGLPLVLIEAQAAGLPCVVSDRVTREADATGAMTFADPSGPPERWRDAILGMNAGRRETGEALRALGWDAEERARWLQRWYAECWNEPELAERSLRYAADADGLYANL